MKTTPTRPILLALALAAVALPGFAAEPVNIARLQTTTIKSYDASNEDLNGGGFFWATPLSNLVNGSLTDGVAPLTAKYVVLDFSSAYFISTIDVTKPYRYKYSLYYSPSSSGDDWVQVPYASNVCRMGTKKWGVYAVASRVKYVFEENGTQHSDHSEIQVFGVPASEMACQHSTLSAWTEVPGSATCTEVALETATCSSCGEVFTRESGGLPLGHDYKANVVKPGKGWFSCSRCNYRVDCSLGAVDLTSVGGIFYDETKVQFTDVSTSEYIYGENWDDNHKNDYIVDNDLSTVWEGSTTTCKATIKFDSDVLLKKIVVTVSGASWDMYYYLKVTALDGSDETTILEPPRYLLSAGDSGVTKTFEFSDKTAKEINVSVWNNGGNHVWVNEIRVYGTVPGAVNYTPALILMQ